MRHELIRVGLLVELAKHYTTKGALSITNGSIKHKSFVYTPLNDETFLFVTVQFIMSFALGLKVRQFYLTNRLDTFKCYSSRSE